MRYISTRGNAPSRPFSEIVLSGLAPDGGLYLPETYPVIGEQELEQWRRLPYRELAFQVIRRFASDPDEADLRAIIDRTYTARTYRSEEIVPLTTVDGDVHILGLSNGPTLAFKDMAMQFLGNLFEHILERTGRTLNLLGATSGDTGSSAEYAMRGKRGIRVFMLSPYGKMSPFQTAQMYSLTDPNIVNLAVRGVFDDCQDLVKKILADGSFARSHGLGTVNSINWARVVAQVVYYFKGYFAATRTSDQEISFSVPTGNFGNVCAGHIARQMGVPIRKLILATNENDVLDEFFRTGVYRVRSSADTYQTSSPSMDISKASNFERFVFDLAGRDPVTIRDLWTRIDSLGRFDLSGTEMFSRIGQFGFVSGASTHSDRLRTVRDLYHRHGLLLDPHTANGLKVGLEHKEKGIPLVCLETALPAKFEAFIVEAIGRRPPRPTGTETIESLPQRFRLIDADEAAVRRILEESPLL